MKKLATSLILFCACGMSAPAVGQPLLECAERFVPAIEQPEGRLNIRTALARGYAQHGSFEKAQALINAAPPAQAREIGQSAAMGALSSGHVEQSLRWAEQYISPREIAWNTEIALALGSDRERLLQSAPTPEAAAQALSFLQTRGGVSGQALAFVNQQSLGLPPLVSEFYLRQLGQVADQLRPIDWAGIEESLEATGPEFAPLRERALRSIIEERSRLVEEIKAMGKVDAATLEPKMIRFGAILLARRGRTEQAGQLWSQAGEASRMETTVYLQNQYLGGRVEALDELIAMGGLEEDAKVDLSLFLLRLGQIEKANALGVEPEAYLKMRQARQDLGRGLRVDQWLDFIAELDRGARAEESRMREIAIDARIPAAVREKAFARLHDETAAQRALGERLASELVELSQAPSDRVAFDLLALDDHLRKNKIELSPENLKLLEEFCSRAPRP